MALSRTVYTILAFVYELRYVECPWTTFERYFDL